MTKFKFVPGEVTFLNEYSNVMKPVAVSLDILQGEDKAFMGILLPIISVCTTKLKILKESTLTYCAPLIDALIKGIEKRFSSQLEDMDCLLASGFHPQFKLTWFKSDENKRRKVEKKMIQLVNEKISINMAQSTSGSDEEESADSFFKDLHKTARKTNQGERLVKNYLEGPVSVPLPSPSSFPCQPFKDLFIEYNTAIPSSAAVERMFSLGKDVLRPKRASLSDKHFEMLVFLKGKL